MKYLLFCCAVWLAPCHAVKAALPFSLEGFLRRADAVLLVRVVTAGQHSVTFQCTEQLRGQTEKEFVLTIDMASPKPLETGMEFLLFSQGDASVGPPLPRLGETMIGQSSWRGWIARRLVKEGDQVYAEGVWSHADGEPSTDGVPGDRIRKLTLSRVKRLIERFPYEPHINDWAKRLIER